MDGKNLCLKDWAIKFGIHAETLKCRLDKGMALKDALSLPVQPARNKSFGEAHHRSKLKAKDVRLIKEALFNGIRVWDVAKQFLVSTKCIQDIKNGRTWAHV